MNRRFSRAVFAALIATTLTLTGGVASGASGVSAGSVDAKGKKPPKPPAPSPTPLEELTDTGVASSEVPVAPLATDQLEEVADKDALIAQTEAYLDAEAEGQMVAMACPAGEVCTGTPPTDFKISQAANMTIHSQNKSYTCGPASLRNMVMVMNRVKNGSWTAETEATYESWLGTGTDGTAIGSIVNVLNSRYGGYGSWVLKDPVDKQAYLAMVVTDTYNYRQPLIQGVRTGYLSYFQGHDLNHFNFAYGFQRSTTTKKINVGEVWDPVKIYGSSSYNPYGHRLPPLQEIFDANDKSGPFGGGARLIV
jgi:hypothetical protein